jgi:hypothetical protein
MFSKNITILSIQSLTGGYSNTIKKTIKRENKTSKSIPPLFISSVFRYGKKHKPQHRICTAPTYGLEYMYSPKAKAKASRNKNQQNLK